LGSEWITIARISWVFQQRFKEDAKPRFVLESNGVSYILFQEDERRLVLKFVEGAQLNEFLIALQGDGHMWGTPNWRKLIKKFTINEKDSKEFLS